MADRAGTRRTRNATYSRAAVIDAFRPHHLNKRLRLLGYDTSTEHCAHGFRSTFSTLCHQEVDPEDKKLWDSDVVELCLAHLDEDSVTTIYNRVGPLALIGLRTR